MLVNLIRMQIIVAVGGWADLPPQRVAGTVVLFFLFWLIPLVVLVLSPFRYNQGRRPNRRHYECGEHPIAVEL